MKNTTLAVSIVATLAGLGMSSIASGAVVVINSRATWDAYVAFQNATVATETFESFADGYRPSATGTAGGTTWTANALNGRHFFNFSFKSYYNNWVFFVTILNHYFFYLIFFDISGIPDIVSN